MTPDQFIAQNVHFAVNLLAALACFTAGWLYLDAWSGLRRGIELARWCGFFLLAAGFLMAGIAWTATDNLAGIATAASLLGYVSLIIGELIDPLQPRPDTSKLGYSLFGLSPGAIGWLAMAVPFGALAMAALYWRRATTGLERHLRPLALIFSLFAISAGLDLTARWRDTDNPVLQPIVAAGGPLWIIQHLVLLAAGAALIWWIWRYLTKRLLTQLFLTTTSLTVGIVLIVTLSITSLLYANLSHDALSNLQTAGKTLGYAISSQTATAEAQAQILSQDPAVTTAVSSHNKPVLSQAASSLLQSQQLSEVIITGPDGSVLARATDPDRIGDSLSADPLVHHALTAGASSTLQSQTDGIVPSLVITSAAPIRRGTAIAGVVLTSLTLDNAFVDGIKSATGLDSTLFSGNVRAATTLTDPDGTTRSTGSRETASDILSTTLRHGQPWSGLHNVANQPYLAAYQPLLNLNQSVVGMMSIGQPQSALFQTAQTAIQNTFASAGLWLVLVLIPVYLVG
ncbi:MAG TPA: cache domain-containing protein, partial [Candidatus Saccharimonas sp.]|nr:cache domain-containing protein [Candidatus Saccharimonas sp.]